MPRSRAEGYREFQEEGKEMKKQIVACTLGYMCMKTGKKICWDPKNEKLLTPEAEYLMKPFARGRFNLDRAYAAL